MLAVQDLIVTIAAVGAGALLLRRTLFASRGEGDEASCPRCDSGGTCHPPCRHCLVSHCPMKPPQS